MAQNLARLGVVLGMDSAEFQKGLKAAKQGLKEFGDIAITATKIGAVAFAAMTVKAIQMSDEIADLAKANDMSIGSILRLSSALELSGGKAESVGRILSSFTNKVDEAAQAGFAAQQAFKRVGISLEDLANLSQQALLNKTVEALAKMPDSITRNALAFDLLGKGIKGTDLRELNEQLKKGTTEYDKYAASIEQAGELNDRLYSKSRKLALMFTNEVMPAVVALFEMMSTKGGNAELVFNILGKAVTYLYVALGEAGDAMDSLSAKFKAIGKGDFLGESGEYLNSMNKIALDRYARAKKIAELLRDKSNDKPKPDDPFGRKVTPGKDPEDEKLKKQEEMLRVAGLINEEYERERSFSLQQLAIRGQMEGMTSNERTIQEAINQQLDATSKKLEDITKKREDAAGRGADPKVLAEYDAQFALVQRNSQQYIDASRIITESTIATQRTFMYGWDKAFNQFAEDAGNYGKLAEDMFNSFTSNMNTAIDNFVENGTFSFSQFAESVIKDILKIELRMQASQLLSMGIKFAIGAFSGAMSSGTTANVHDYSTPYTAFADGGNPPVGVPSLVGERGPELFIPSRAGTIIPNNQLGNVLSGGGGVTYNGPYIASMQAIDTQSGIQFLAKNKMTIWSMNQSANRSIPAGR